MTHEDAGHYAAKHPSGTVARPEITAAVKKKMRRGEISCASAHGIAMALAVSPQEVGVSIDLLECRINKCQLGLFGHTPEKKILRPSEEGSPELEKFILNESRDGRITCEAIWNMAEAMGISKIEAASACEALKIKINRCQLGSFQ